MGKKNPHVSDESFSDYVRERDQREPGFKNRLDTMADQARSDDEGDAHVE